MPGLDVRFVVKGIPLPKGNMSGFPIDRGACPDCARKLRHSEPRRNCFGGRIVGVSVTDQGSGELKTWQQLVHFAAISARNKAAQRMLKKPAALWMSLVFVVPRPASVSIDERPFPTIAPDLDKLTRTIQDAMTDSLVDDDSQVIIARLAEVYADRRGWTGVDVHARQLLSLDAWVEHQLGFHGVWSPPEASKQETLL